MLELECDIESPASTSRKGISKTPLPGRKKPGLLQLGPEFCRQQSVMEKQMPTQPTKAAGRPAGQYVFRDPIGLLKLVRAGDTAGHWKNEAYSAGVKSFPLAPRQMNRTFRRLHCMHANVAYRLLDTIGEIARKKKIEVPAGVLDLDTACLQFDTLVLGLSALMHQVQFDHDFDPYELIGYSAGTTAAVVRAASRSGTCVLLPFALADAIAKAAATILQLQAPLEARRYTAAALAFKPIGGVKHEAGAPAYNCDETFELRRQVILAMRDR